MADSDMPDEHWLPVPVDAYADLYQVGDGGHVWSNRSGRALVPYPVHGYPTVQLYRSCAYHQFAVHVLVARAFLGPCPPGQEVRHWDGNQQDPALTNLRYGTPSDNARDRVRHGTHNMTSRARCPLGHEHAPWNARKSGASRRCLACHRGGEAVRAAARRGVILDRELVAWGYYLDLREHAAIAACSQAS